MLPEGGYDAVGQLTGNGVMIVGDAAGLLNLSLYKEGTNHAMESGKLAGETAVEAKKKGDFSRQGLAGYEEKLKQGVAYQDVLKYRDLPYIMKDCPDLLSLYPRKVTQMLVDYFTVTAEPKHETQKRARREFFSGVSKIKMARDLFKARKLL
jgi:electron transfer flavoprotein-quinone oxidoreductase